MLGRSLVGRPWSTLAIKTRIDGAQSSEISPDEKYRIALDHYNDTLEFYGEGKGLRVARKHLAGYVEHSNFGGEKDALKSRICQSTDTEEVRALLRKTFLGAEMAA